MNDESEMMAGAPSYNYQNKEYLLEVIMNQLNITREDLERDPSWVKAKVRESNIDKVLS